MDRSRAAPVVALLLLVSLFAGCVEVSFGPSGDGDDGPAPPPQRTPDDGGASPPPASPPPASPPSARPDVDTLQRWRDQASTHGPAGLEATLDLAAEWAYLTGELTADPLTAPFDLLVEELFPEDAPLVFLPEATVAGHGTGLLVVEGARLQATAGATGPLSLERVFVGEKLLLAPHPVHIDAPEKPNVTFPETWSAAERGLFFTTWVDVPLDAVVLDGHDRALLVNDAGSTPLTGALTVTARGLWSEDGLRLATASVTLDTGAFGYAGNTTAGEVQASASPHAAERPTAVFGRDARLALSAHHVSSEGTFRWDQAVVADGLVLPATVELHAPDDTATVGFNETTWVKVHVREAGYVGAAALETVRVDGPGKDLVKVPLERPPTLVETLWEMVEATGPLAGFFALPVAIASPFLLLLEGLTCLFGGCPWNDAYPAWLEPGQIESFNVQVTGDAAPGTYDATVVFVGQNHEDVRLPLRILVEG